MKLEDLTPGSNVLLPGERATVFALDWHGEHSVELTYKNDSGQLRQRQLDRSDQREIYPEGKHPDHWDDHSLIEAASWRLASELVRRHPATTRMYQTHPGDGMYDCLSVQALDGNGQVALNRAGSLHVLDRFDGRPVDWESSSWAEYLRADPREFLGRLEAAAGLPAPSTIPASTPASLTNRVLAAIAATAVKSVQPVFIVGAFVSEGQCGEREPLAPFAGIPSYLAAAPIDDLPWERGYRFWVVVRGGEPILAVTAETGLVFNCHHPKPVSVMDKYIEYRRDLLYTSAKLLRFADGL